MAIIEQSNLRNRLLSLATQSDFALLSPHLTRIDLPRRFGLAEINGPIDYVFFPESGITSIVATSPDNEEVEAGIFGFEGVGPIAALLGSDIAPHRIFMQIGGHGHRIDRSALQAAMNRSVTLRDLLLRFVHVLNIQTIFTALSNAVHPIDERLARWLLMCHDRVTSDDIPLTHEYIAVMLAVRRPSITTALHVLEGNGFITADRGNVTIRNRKALEIFAANSYGKPEAEYLRLIGPLR